MRFSSLEVACSNGFVLLLLFFWFGPAVHCHPLCCVVTFKHPSLRSFSLDRSNTLNRSSYARDSMTIEEILAPTKDTVRPPNFLTPPFPLPHSCLYPLSVVTLSVSLCHSFPPLFSFLCFCQGHCVTRYFF